MNASLMKKFERHMIQTGDPDSFFECDASIRDLLHKKLQENLSTVTSCMTSPNQRRLNNFCLGSDPEFVFVAPGERHKTDARRLGLYPGLAAGCDQNLRLAELRGYPTTSVVEHLAGILSSLRWMYLTYPNVRAYYWRAGSYYDGDGIGGHIHFGRKKPTREEEVAALDGLAHMTKFLRFFDADGWNKRNQPDEHRNQGYGRLGDIRQQLHGYEYRTLPSWLCDPLKAFVILTAAKLAVLDPDLTRTWIKLEAETCSLPQGQNRLLRFARYYAGRDDDAWLMKSVLARPDFLNSMKEWKNTRQDFKLSWGFPKDIPYGFKNSDNQVLPAVIKPLLSEIKEIQDHLSEGKPVGFEINKPTFRSKYPADYYWMLPLMEGGGLNWPGVGDLTHNLFGSAKSEFRLRFSKAVNIPRRYFDTHKDGARLLEKARRLFPDAFFRSDTNVLDLTRQSVALDKIKTTRDMLLNWGVFPVWTTETVETDSFPKYLASRKIVMSSKPKEQVRYL